MSEAKVGDKVRVHYVAFSEEGTQIDSTRDRKPVEFIVGEGMVLPGFDKSVTGMKEGEIQTIVLKPEDGFGLRNDNLILKLQRAQIPENIELQPGLVLGISNQEGSQTKAVVREVHEETVTVDANHPLAGKALKFDIELLEVVTS